MYIIDKYISFSYLPKIYIEQAIRVKKNRGAAAPHPELLANIKLQDCNEGEKYKAEG